jgi:hypothetical protein
MLSLMNTTGEEYLAQWLPPEQGGRQNEKSDCSSFAELGCLVRMNNQRGYT